MVLKQSEDKDGTAIVQLDDTSYLAMTRKQRLLLQIDRTTLKLAPPIPYPPELTVSVGIAKTEMTLYITDGTHKLHMLDATTFGYLGFILLKDEQGSYLYKLSELEIVPDSMSGVEYLWGTQTSSNVIVKIDLSTGQVIKRYDLTLLDELRKLQFA